MFTDDQGSVRLASIYFPMEAVCPLKVLHQWCCELEADQL